MSAQYRAQIVTRDLENEEEAIAELPFIIEIFRGAGLEEVPVHYWGGEIIVGLAELIETFRNGFKDKYTSWRLGGSDFTIYNNTLDIEVEFCHEWHHCANSSNRT